IKIRGSIPGLNKILTSDANGLAVWAPVPSFDPVPFQGTNSVDISIANGVETNINFNVEEYDVGGNFNSGVFTAPATGIYHFDVNISWDLSFFPGNYQLYTYLNVSGSRVKEALMVLTINSTHSQSISVDLNLTASHT